MSVIYKQYNSGVIHLRPACSLRKRSLNHHVPAKVTPEELAALIATGNWRPCEKCNA